MAGFPYGSARGLGGMQIFLGLAAMGLGGGDLFMGFSVNRYDGPYFHFYLLGTGIWTGLFIGAAQTMSLLNTFIFAPGLAGVSAISLIQYSGGWYYYGIYGNYVPGYVYVQAHYMFYVEIALGVVGGLEFIFAIATASVCCCGGPYDQPAANQVVPMPMMAFHTPVQQPVAPAPMARPSFAERPGPSGGATGGDGQMVTLPAAELGVLYAKASAVEE
uniref:Transmembrane protein n=1 Tax=Branchiostoma floridae TaxID=7739 RepID=C3YU57_BRAFL|eukprot:XP_002600322.1 hypothetical protein BRAFLDRAFT_66824 [Branchiostoma floridae]